MGNLGKIVLFAIRTKPGTALIESALSGDRLYTILIEVHICACAKVEMNGSEVSMYNGHCSVFLALFTIHQGATALSSSSVHKT